MPGSLLCFIDDFLLQMNIHVILTLYVEAVKLVVQGHPGLYSELEASMGYIRPSLRK